MSSEKNKIISYKKSFTPKNIAYPKSKKHYLNENDKSTDSTEQQYESKALLNTDKIIGNYFLTKKISKTSYTKIFLAKHILTRENVTIRIIKKQLFKNDLLSLTRFNKELKILKTIKHPNIIKLLEIIETNSKIYLISEFFPHNLLSLIHLQNKLSENKARFLFQQLISSLNYLHSLGISHRNIKPENVLLDEKYSIIKITGFNVSTFYKQGSLLNSPVGTLLFAPPEMILSKKYKGELNDIWNAGIILYAMLCGKLPFSQDNQDVNINHIIEGFYEIPKYISSNCAEVIKACLECNPEKRITFDKLKNLKWIKHKNFEYIKGINTNRENIFVDEIILHECKKYISANNQDILNKIKKSVIENKFDEFSSLYYLVFQKQAKKGYKSIFDFNKNNIIYNYIDITNSNNSIENISDRDDFSNYSSHTHTNSFSSFIQNKNNKFDFFDISNDNKNINIVNKYLTIKNMKKQKKNISSLNIRNKKYIFSPQNKNNINKNNIINYISYHRKILNRFKSTEIQSNQLISTPKIYTKKTSFITNPKFLNIKSKSNNKVEKNITMINFDVTDKIKRESIEKINNNNDNNNQTLSTLFVNRVKNVNNNFYSNPKRKNKSSEGFYFPNKNNDYKTKTNLISINKKNLFIHINNNDYNKEKYENNIDQILMYDQPVANFSMNLNNTLLDSTNNKKIQNNKNEITNINNNNTNNNIIENDCIKKQSILKIHKKNVKSYKRLDYFFETPKKIRDSYYFKYNHKYNLKTNHYFELNSSNKGNNSINSFNNIILTGKLLRPNVLRNSKNDQYNTMFYQDEKTLNKIKSFGGLKIMKQNNNLENELQKNFYQNTYSLKNKYNNCIKSLESNDKKINKKENKKNEINKRNEKIEKNTFYSKFSELENINTDIGVLDLVSVKLCLYDDLIEKIKSILKKYKIKYYFINQNKIHCSGRTGLFFDIEIISLKSKNSNIKNRTLNNNIYTNKNNNKILVQKMDKTSLGFKQINKNNKKTEHKYKEMFYIKFICKQNDFRKANSKLIYDILC